MKAITQYNYGDPADVLQLQDIDVPEIKDDQVLVRVKAAGTHIGDWLTVKGIPYPVRLMGFGLMKPKNRVPGMEMSGVVEEIGEKVTQFKVGDEVFGWGKGAFAEYGAFAEDSLALKPANASFEQAAVVPISAFTALQAVRDHGEVQPGQTVMVIGASGGVGTFAVQIAKAYGAEVTGVCSAKNIDMVRSIGADHVIDYTEEDITRAGQRYDVIIDTAGNRALSGLRRALNPKGTLVIVGGSGGRILMGAGRSMTASLLSLFIGQRLRSFISKTTKKDLLVLKELIETGKVTPIIDRTYCLGDAAKAIGYIGERHTQGKTVIAI